MRKSGRLLRNFLMFFTIIFLFGLSNVSAEVKTYEGTGEFAMIDEPIQYATDKAKLEAERNISEQVYVYVEGKSESKDSILQHDEVISATESLMKIRYVKYQYSDEGNYILVKAIVTADVDMDDVDKIIARMEEKRGK